MTINKSITSGLATIKKGFSSIGVKTEAVQADSLILLTQKKEPGSNATNTELVYEVTSPGELFRIFSFKAPDVDEMKIVWMIVNP